MKYILIACLTQFGISESNFFIKRGMSAKRFEVVVYGSSDKQLPKIGDSFITRLDSESEYEVTTESSIPLEDTSIVTVSIKEIEA